MVVVLHDVYLLVSPDYQYSEVLHVHNHLNFAVQPGEGEGTSPEGQEGQARAG